MAKQVLKNGLDFKEMLDAKAVLKNGLGFQIGLWVIYAKTVTCKRSTIKN